MESLAEHRGQMSQSSDASVDAFVVVATATATALAVATTPVADPVAEQVANVVTALAEQDPKKPSSSSNQDTGVSNLGVLIV